MSWTFTVTTPEGFTKTATIRNAEFSDTDRTDFRQGRGTTESGLVFVQDLDSEDRFIEASWGFLTLQERADLEDFFGRDGTLRQVRPFSIDIAGSSFQQKLKVGALVGGGVWKVGASPTVFKVGQTVQPDTANLRNVFLDQPDLSFPQERDERYSLDLRFRIHGPAT